MAGAIITAVKRVSYQLWWFQFWFFPSLDGRNQRIGIAVMGRFNLYIGDQI